MHEGNDVDGIRGGVWCIPYKVPMSRRQTGLLGEEVREIEVLVLGPEVEADVLEFVTASDQVEMQGCPG